MDGDKMAIKIQSNSKEYQVVLEKDFHFWDALSEQENTLFVIDEKVYQLYQSQLFERLLDNKIFRIEANENNKTIEKALAICEKMTDFPAKKNAQIIAIGGGITQDIVGFAANILYRGIKWSLIPTTLLAACDSCIGGKTSLNYRHYKNLLGTFYPPDNIYICSQFFRTLTEEDYKSGLGEVVKFNVMAGLKGIRKLESDLSKLLEREPMAIDYYVKNSLLFKKSFIEEDEFDRGIRIHLNFAHTFGHAFETVSQYAIPHGTAVAMGMLVANAISYKRGYMTEQTMQRIEHLVSPIISHISTIDIDDINLLIDAIKKDKKQMNSQLTAVLFNNENMELKVFHDVKREEIKDAIEHLQKITRGSNHGK